MVDPSSFATFGAKTVKDAIGDVRDHIEYWREFKGKTVQIRSEEMRRTADQAEFTAFVIEGQVDDVLSYPAGFRLRDVREYVEYLRQTNTRFKSGEVATDSLDTVTTEIRSVDTKFVAFSNIDQMEWPEDDVEDLPPES